MSIPLTIAVVGSYVLWDWKLSKKAGKEDEATELRMLDMKRNSRSQAVRIAASVALGIGVIEKVRVGQGPRESRRGPFSDSSRTTVTLARGFEYLYLPLADAYSAEFVSENCNYFSQQV